MKKQKDFEHTAKIKKQYADKSEKMKGAGNWNYGKERTLEHSYKISASKLKNSTAKSVKSFDEYKLDKEQKIKEQKIKSSLTKEEIKQMGVEKNSASRRVATANEVISVLLLICKGNSVPNVLKEIKAKNPKSEITLDGIKNIKLLRTRVYSIEPEFEEYKKTVEYYNKHKDENKLLKNKTKDDTNALKKRKIGANIIMDILTMYKEEIKRSDIIANIQKKYPDNDIKEGTVKNVRRGRTAVISIEPEYEKYVALYKQVSGK